MIDGLRDLIAVVQCGRLACGTVAALRYARSGARDAVQAFDRVVLPLVGGVKDDAARSRLRDALLSTGVTFDYLISSYASMADLPLSRELSVLGGAFARLYDDLLDEGEGAGIDGRLSVLFHGEGFSPANDLEALLGNIYVEIDNALGRPPGDLIFGALRALHEYQRMSRLQSDPDVAMDALNKIERGKGGLANVVAFSLVRNDMTLREQTIIMELGEALQLLDDYLDIHVDRGRGITTAVTRGDLGLPDVARRLRAVRPQLIAYYGRRRSRRFLGMLFTLILAAFLKRRWPWVRDGRARTPMGLLIFRGTSAITPTSIDQHGHGAAPFA